MHCKSQRNGVVDVLLRFIFIVYFISINHSLFAQDWFSNERLVLETSFTDSLKDFSVQEINNKVDSIFNSLEISDTTSIYELFDDLQLGEMLDSVDKLEMLNSFDWKDFLEDLDWSQLVEEIDMNVLIQEMSKLDSNTISRIDNMQIPFQNFYDCQSMDMQEMMTVIDMPCFFKLMREEKVTLSIENFDKFSKCMDMTKMFQLMDWPCIMKSFDMKEVIKLYNTDSLFKNLDTLTNSNYMDWVENYASQHPILKNVDISKLKKKFDNMEVSDISPKLRMKLFKKFSEMITNEFWNESGEREYFGKVTSLITKLLVKTIGITQSTKRFIVSLNTMNETLLETKNYNNKNLLPLLSFQKDLLLQCYLDNTYDSLNYLQTQSRFSLGNNFEIKALASLYQNIATIDVKLQNFNSAIKNYQIAEIIHAKLLRHYNTSLTLDSLYKTFYNEKELVHQMKKYKISYEEFDFVKYELTQRIIPSKIDSLIKKKNYNDAIEICKIIHDVVIEEFRLDRFIPKYMQTMKFLNAASSSIMLENFYSMFSKLVTSLKKKDFEEYVRISQGSKIINQAMHQQGLLLLNNNRSSLYYFLGNYSEYLKYQLKSWNLLKKNKNLDFLIPLTPEYTNIDKSYNNKMPIRSLIASNIASLYLTRNENEKAVEFLEHAIIDLSDRLSVNSEQESQKDLDMFNLYAAQVHAQLAIYNKDGAFKAAEKCLIISNKYDFKNQKLLSNLLMSQCHLFDGNTKSALEHSKRSLNLAKNMDRQFDISRAHLHLSRGYNALGDFDKAHLHLDSVMNIAVKLNSKTLKIQVLQFKGYVYKSENKIDKAYNTFLECISLSEEQVFLSIDKTSKTRQLKLHSNFNIYSGAISCALKINKKEEAFKHVQQIKARILKDMLADGTLKSEEIPDSLKVLKNRVLFELNALQKSTDDIPNVGALMMGPQDSLLKELEIVETKIRKSSKRYKNLSNSDSPLMEDISRRLGNNEAFIDYFVGDSIYAFVITRDRHLVFTVDHDKEVFSEINALINLTEDKNRIQTSSKPVMEKAKTEMMEYSRNIYPKVFAEIHDSGILDNMEELIISPDYEIYKLPFDMLLLHEDDWDVDSTVYLGDLYTIQYTPSASLFDSTSTIKVSNNKGNPKMLVLEKSNFNEYPDLRNLSFSSDALITKFKTVDIINGKQATSNYLNGLNLSKYDYLHLSSHAVINEVPELSYLALTNSQLSLFNMFDLDLNCKLAVLSACQTAKGQFQRGGGVMGFTRGLMYAGVESLVISLWPIEDKASQILFDEFWSLIASGYPPNISLQRAKQHLRRTDTKYDNPFYWAGFVLLGYK